MTGNDAEVAAVKAEATGLIPFLRERAEEIDRLGHLPDEVVQAMHDVGVYRINEPTAFGGGGLGPVSLSVLCDVIIEVGKGNGSAAWSVMINLGNFFFPSYGDEIAREALTRPHVGPRICGTVFQNHAKAEGRRVDGGYLIKGTWGYPSNVWHAAWLFGAFNYTDDDDTRQIGMAMLPRAEFEIADDWHVEGMKGSGSNSAYTTSEVFVPSERAIPWLQFQQVDQRVHLSAHLGISALVIGCAHGALECFLDVAPRRGGWGGAPTIASMPSTQSTVAKVRAQIALAELALRHATQRHDHALDGGPAVSVEEAALLDYANVYATHQVRRAVEELVIAVGSNAAAETDPVTRFVRDLRVACLHGLIRPEPYAEKYGRVLLGVEEATGFKMTH